MGLEVSRTLTSLEARHWCGDLDAPCEQVWEIGEGKEEEADEGGDDKDECFSAVEWSMHCDKIFTSSCKMKLFQDLRCEHLRAKLILFGGMSLDSG